MSIPASWVAPHPSPIPDAIAFQDPIDEICERPAPPALRGTLYLVGGLFVSLLLIAAFAKVDVVVVASGRIATASPPIVLQPMERAIVRDVRVHPGDMVEKGEVLATLDPTFAEADTVALRQQLSALRARVRRLQAQATGQPFAPDASADADDALQATLYRQRQAEYAARLRVFDEDIDHLQAGLRTAADDRESLARELDVARQVEEMRTVLMQSQNGSRLTLLEARAARMRAERDEQEVENRLRELQHGEQSREAERQAFVESWRREPGEALVGAQTELAQVAASLAKASRLHDLVVVTAPVDGIVLDVAPRTEGSVLREAEPLLTIVPKDAPLIAEITIASADVGDTRAGADVHLKIDAFPYQRFGMVAGRLQSVGEESFAPEATPSGRGGAFHRARVALADAQLPQGPGGRLIPGMTLSAEIASGSRGVLSYFLNPLTRSLTESLREP
jgi:HlyD family secretion protein